MAKGKKKRRSMNMFQKMDEDGNSGKGDWETGPVSDSAVDMDTAEAKEKSVLGRLEDSLLVRKKISKRGNRTRNQKRRKSAGVTKALAIAERTNEKTRKVRQRSEKKKASKALWEGDAS